MTEATKRNQSGVAETLLITLYIYRKDRQGLV